MVEQTREPLRKGPGDEGTFDEEAVARILQKATEIERLKSKGGTKLTAAEVESIARDAGIDPASVARAIADLRGEPPKTLVTALLGEPARRVIERVIATKIEASDHERIVAFLRGELAEFDGVAPNISSLGRSLTYFSRSEGRAANSIEVQLLPEGEGTMVRIIVSTYGLARGIMGATAGIIGGGVTPMGFLVGTALAHSTGMPAGVGIASVVAIYLGSVFAGARALYGNLARKRRERGDAVMTKLEEHLLKR